MECAVAGYNLKKKKRKKSHQENESISVSVCILNNWSYRNRYRSVFRIALGETEPEQLDHHTDKEPALPTHLDR